MSIRRCSPFVALLLLGVQGVAAQTNSKAPATDLRDILVPMRDGVHLATDVFLPAIAGKWPAVLVRTPYSRHALAIRGYRFFLQRGYALVVQDLRGRYASQGTFGLITQEAPDGSDTINWIASQPWSNGRVAMAGSSFLGLVQWWAAIEGNAHLRAISPMFSGDDEYSDRYYSTGGALQLGHRLLWFAENFPPTPAGPPPLNTYIGHLPLRTADEAATQQSLKLWQLALDHPSFDFFWQQQSIRNVLNRVSAPVLSFGGWFDAYAASDLDAFGRLAKADKPIETWIGPWAHNPGLHFSTRDFGPEATITVRAKQADWFDRWMKKPGNAAQERETAVLHIFVMGPDVWRKENEWPLARTRYTPLYLVSAGHANTSAGDGTLSWQLPWKSKADAYTYDPRNPVPTSGGSVCCEPAVFPPGPLDQSAVETRPDVLVYTSPPLAEEIEVTGLVRTILYVSTSANDTDFTAKLVDIQPDGKPLLVTDGIQRLRYRLSLSNPVYVKRYQAYQISVDTGVTSYVFAARHRIRLEVSSSNFPRFDRNLNGIGPIADQTKPVKARQMVFHQKGYPSAIILPVIGRSREPRATGRIDLHGKANESSGNNSGR
jgi:predicted acyl esterase